MLLENNLKANISKKHIKKRFDLTATAYCKNLAEDE